MGEVELVGIANLLGSTDLWGSTGPWELTDSRVSMDSCVRSNSCVTADTREKARMSPESPTCVGLARRDSEVGTGKIAATEAGIRGKEQGEPSDGP